MNFRLFGFDIEVQAGFWLTTMLLGWSRGYAKLSHGPAGIYPLLVWAAVVFVSVTVHELGHAIAIRRHGIQPEIELYTLGGRTMWRQILPLKRPDLVIISLAGPVAGFLFAAALYALLATLDRYAPMTLARMPELGRQAIRNLLWVNVGWGLFNLIPVSPLDGGHVLENVLGPKRARLSAGLSLVIGLGVTLWALQMGETYIGFMFGFLAFQNMRRMQALAPDADTGDPTPIAPPPDREPPLTGELLSLLSRARAAVAEENVDLARSLCAEILKRSEDTEDPAPPRAKREALEVLAWAALVADKPDEASRHAADARKLGDVDAALVGAIHFAKRELGQAKRVLEAARSSGDDRKEIVGPLVQIHIEQGEIARAAAIAYDIVDSLSEEDARHMAKLAFDGRAFDWSARLYEVVFERRKEPEDAYEAARANAQDGSYERALDMLKKAVEAGFSDRGRVWSDTALETLRARAGLETVVPRP